MKKACSLCNCLTEEEYEYIGNFGFLVVCPKCQKMFREEETDEILLYRT